MHQLIIYLQQLTGDSILQNYKENGAFPEILEIMELISKELDSL